MTFPSTFVFSQASLQDFVDCRRRFYLRFLQRLAWPAVEAEPMLENERALALGESFHRLVQQHLVGIPTDRLSAMIHDDDLQSWWGNYLASRSNPKRLEGLFGATPELYPEVNLSAVLGGYTLGAKCDLVLHRQDGRLIILDWKTSRQRPKRPWLASRLQTRIYPYLLVRAGMHLNAGKPIQPEQVEMVYWYAAFPERPERFAYSQEQYQADEAFLSELVAEITRLEEADFSLTQDERRCRYCVYRSLCERGVRAGPLGEIEETLEAGERLEISIDFDQIGEISF